MSNNRTYTYLKLLAREAFTKCNNDRYQQLHSAWPLARLELYTCSLHLRSNISYVPPLWVLRMTFDTQDWCVAVASIHWSDVVIIFWGLSFINSAGSSYLWWCWGLSLSFGLGRLGRWGHRRGRGRWGHRRGRGRSRGISSSVHSLIKLLLIDSDGGGLLRSEERFFLVRWARLWC